MDNFQLFGSLVGKIHGELVNCFYLFLPVFFALAIVVDWFSSPGGTPDFLGTLKRGIIATLLMVTFQEVSDTILLLANGLADKISDLNGLDNFMKMASEKSATYTPDVTSAILKFDDFFISLLTFASYIVLYFARYITVALYHFLWSLLCILSPILILFTLFKGTLSIPINLFKSLIEVASYKIIWAILSAMLTALSFGNSYAADGNYLTVIILNFVIALAMLATPVIVRSLSGSGISSMAESLGAGAVMAMVSIPGKAAAATQFSKGVLGNTKDFMMHNFSKPKFSFTPDPPPPPIYAGAPPKQHALPAPPLALPPPSQPKQ